MPSPKDISDASRQLESMLVRQLLAASGAFKPSGVAGGQLQTDMFVEALADAVVKGGGLGITRMLERELGTESGDAGDDAGPREGPAAAPLPSFRTGHRALAPVPPPATGWSPAPLTESAGGPTVTSGFGPRLHPIDGGVRFHTGVDLRGAEGTPITAAAPGVVKSAGARGGYGNAVEIDHGGGVTTLYGHASELTVRPGDHIEAGQEVARVGHTGHATGPHLHFEVRLAGRPVDPARALNAYGIRVDKTIGAKP